jgi:hypothetical protein
MNPAVSSEKGDPLRGCRPLLLLLAHSTAGETLGNKSYNAHTVRSPEVLVSKQIDYELDQYDEYMERAQHLVESGSVAEAGAFVGLGGSLLRESKDVQGNR